VSVSSVQAVDAERGRAFALLARLLSAAPDDTLLAGLGALQGDASALGEACAALGTAARGTTAAVVEREFFALFVGVGRGEVLPFASYVLTGFLHERPLAELRGTLRALGIERSPDTSEPEDHIAFCCDVMAGLLDGRFDGDADDFFARHLRPWAGRCMAELEAAPSARFYRAVGRFGRTLLDIETAAAELPA
jgi:TorA maturation chaperone TorD